MDQYYPYTFVNVPAGGSDDKSLSIPGAMLKSVHHRPFVGSLKIVDVTKQRTWIDVDGQAIPAEGWILNAPATSDLTITVTNDDVAVLSKLKVSVRTEGKGL
jgi:hypothetical protein